MNMDLKLEHNVKDRDIENDDHVHSSIKNAIAMIAEKEDYICYKTYKKIISSEGGNYLGDLYEIDIKGETAKGLKKETNIFVKHIMPNSDNIKLLSVSDAYNIEIFVYKDLARIYNDLQHKANIPINKRFKLVKIYDESNHDALFFENMAKRGFKTYNRLDVINLNYANYCVEHLAKFHALTFVIERKMPEYFENNIKPLKSALRLNSDSKSVMNKVYELATRKLSTDLKIKTDTWWKIASENYLQYWQGKMTDIKCFCHGDYKMNNIMYKEIEEEITEVIAVDYQIAHYGSPITDLIYFICMGTTQKFRRMHLNQLKDHYYISLKQHLEYFDMPIDNVYPRETFEKDFENYLDYGLVSCVWLLPFSLVSQDETPDLSNTENIDAELKLDDKYYDRLQGIFEDFFKVDK